MKRSTVFAKNECHRPAARFAGVLLLGLVFVFSMPRFTSADVTVKHEKTADGNTVVVYRFSVTPAAEPSPAFKYRLTVPPHKTRPGNAATHYLRSYGENGLTSEWKRATEKYGTGVYDWWDLGSTEADVPIKALREVSGFFDNYIEDYIRRATHCRDCDWGLGEEDLQGKEIIEFALSGAQQTRLINRMLAIRTRLAIEEERYDDTIDHLRMNYQLGQNVGKIRFMVTSLMGIIEVGVANQGMIALIGAPDSPNMYWALAELSDPIISTRDSFRLSMSGVFRYIPDLEAPELAVHTRDRWAEIHTRTIDELKEYYNLVTKPSGSEFAKWSLASGETAYANAKKRLINWGMTKSRVDAMAAGQVLMIDMSRDAKEIADHFEKTLYVPVWKKREFSDASDAKLKKMMIEFRPGAIWASQTNRAIWLADIAAARVQREINSIQLVEAIRLHLAEHGQFPASLDDIEVPVPLNPLTGKPFEYRVENETAIIEMPLSDGAFVAWRHEIKLAPKTITVNSK